MKVAKIIFGLLLFAGIFLPFFISADNELLNKDQVKNYLSIPENDNQQIMHTLIQLLTNEWVEIVSSADRNSREDGVIATLRHSIKINALKFLLLDAPIEVVQKVVLTSIKIAKIAYGITDLGDVVGVIENETAKRAVEYGFSFLLKNDIRVTSGALEMNFVSYNNNQQNIIFQYVTTLKPNPDKTTGVAIAILSKDSFEPPISTFKTPWRYDDWLAEGHTKIEPFIISINGTMQKNEFNNYYWQDAPSIEISFPDSVPDLGFRPTSFWQRHLWQPLENQAQDALVMLQKFIPSTSGIFNSLNDIWQNINQAGASIGNSFLEFFGNMGTSIIDFASSNPQPSNQPTSLAGQIDLSSIGSQGLPLSQLPPPQPQLAPAPAPTPPPDTSYVDGLARQLAALLEQIDNVSEEIDLLSSQQTPLEAPLLTGRAPNDDLATNTILPPVSLSTPATSSNTLASYQPINNSPSAPPPMAQILISEVKTDSQNSANDEYIELYNPNNFSVNLGGLILRKKTASGSSESILVSSKKFQGNIAALGYFLITPQTITGDLHYSGTSTGYYIAQTNSILLYDSYNRLLDRVENVTHPTTHSFGRESTNGVSAFEIQLPTPGYNNQKDTIAPQIILSTKPNATTSTTTAEFSFFADKPDCIFEHQLDNVATTSVKFKNLALGQHSFQIKAVDPVGNVSNILEYSWMIVAATSAPATPSTSTPATSTPATTTPSTTTPATTTPPVLLISEAQIRDASSTDNDFVEIFNPNNQTIDISDFQLKKQTSSGTSTGYSLRVFPANSVIPANSYFLWTNSDYAIPGLTPNATSTQTLASNNSVALFYTDHTTIIDQVAWGSSTNPFMETAPFAPNPADNQTIARQQDSSGNYLDTNDNSVDFVLASPTPTNSLGQTIQLATSSPATSTPATSTPATTSPAYDPTAPVITDLQANPAADREAIDLWWSNESNNNVNYYLINYDNQTLIFNTATTTNPTVYATTVAGLIGGQSYQFTAQAITSSGATSGPSNIATATPLSAFQDNGDGTVNDLYTGLMWPKDGASASSNNGQTLTWFDARTFCDQLVMCNDNQFATTTSTSSDEAIVACADKGGVKYDDWRLPNFKELALLIKYQKSPNDGVMIDSRYFQNIASDKYWSASFKYAIYYNQPTIEKWDPRYIDFASGFVDIADVRPDETYVPFVYNYVLPVRGNSVIVSPSGFDEPAIGCSLGYAIDANSLVTDLCAGQTKTWQISIPSVGSLVDWSSAMLEAASSTLAGYTDWRLPNSRELLMSVNVGPQGGVSNHWAITPDYQTNGQHWWVDLGSLLNIGQSQTMSNNQNNYFKLFRGQ